MEFQSGTISYDIPPAEWRNHFRRKYTTDFRSMDANKAGILYRKDTMVWAERAAEYAEDEEKKRQIIADQVETYDACVLYGKESITEKGYVDEFTRRAFSDPTSRKKYMEDYRKFARVMFDPIDVNRNGVIEEKEFFDFYSIYGCKYDSVKVLFDHIDVDKDGSISVDEFCFALVSWAFSSGPGDIVSTWSGPLVEEYEKE